MKTLTLFAAMLIGLTSLACFTSYMRGYHECPPDNVCYIVDASERVQWHPGGHDKVLFKVQWYYNYEQLRAHAPEELNNPYAWNECWDYDDGSRFCEIHVVRPEFVWGDPRMDDLGHEVLHGFIDTPEGQFHE